MENENVGENIVDEMHMSFMFSLSNLSPPRSCKNNEFIKMCLSSSILWPKHRVVRVKRQIKVELISQKFTEMNSDDFHVIVCESWKCCLKTRRANYFSPV